MILFNIEKPECDSDGKTAFRTAGLEEERYDFSNSFSGSERTKTRELKVFAILLIRAPCESGLPVDFFNSAGKT